MAINPQAVGTKFPPVSASWAEKDCRIYALGVGAGASDPLEELQFTTQNSTGIPQKVLPTFGLLSAGSAGVRGLINHLGVRVETMLHGDQKIELHRELPVEGSVVTEAEVTELWDKGKAAVVTTRATARDATSGEPYCTCTQTMFLRGEGGWGGERGPAAPPLVPDGAADEILTAQTSPSQGLLYRLSGDTNPLHSDPLVAKKAGFPRPILHGLCVFGFAGRVLLGRYAGGDPARFVSLEGRFTNPTLPGDTLSISTWQRSDSVEFAVHDQQGTLVLGSGNFQFRN